MKEMQDLYPDVKLKIMGDKQGFTVKAEGELGSVQSLTVNYPRAELLLALCKMVSENINQRGRICNV